MLEFLAVFIVAIAATIGAACAINFFWRPGFLRALGYAAFFVAIFLIFCMSGLWDGASRHSWGVLTPVFVLMLLCGWMLVKFGRRGCAWLLEWKRKKFSSQ